MAEQLNDFKLLNMHIGNFGDALETKKAIAEIMHNSGPFDAVFLQSVPWRNSESKFWIWLSISKVELDSIASSKTWNSPEYKYNFIIMPIKLAPYRVLGFGLKSWLALG